MLVLGINKILEWCQITTGGRRYTCPIEDRGGVLFFKFKKEWHPIINYVSDYTTELVQEGGKVFTRLFRKER